MKAMDVTFIPGEGRPVEPVRLDLVAVDYIQLERQAKIRLTDTPVSYEQMVRLAFFALTRTHQVPTGCGGFQEFIEAIVDVDPVADEEMDSTDPLGSTTS